MSFLTGPNTVLTRRLQGIDRPPAVPNALDDEFYGTSLDAKWTWLDQGATIANVMNGSLTLRLTDNANRMRAIYQATPGGAYTFRAKVIRPQSNNTSFSHSTLFLGQGAGATDDQNGLAWFGGQHRPLVWASPSSAPSDWIGIAVNDLLQSVYYEISFNGTSTATVRFSYDGVAWAPWASQTLSYTPAIVGLAIGNNTNDMTLHQFDWFRRTA